VLMTGFGDSETRAGASRLGAAAVFDKPLDLRELRKTVAELVRNRSTVTPAPV
jgi:DNA-binding NtrC family response regulator